MVGISKEDVSTLWQCPRRMIPFLIRKYSYATSDVTYNEGGVDIFEEDWDSLVILDACRHDYLQSESKLSGDTSFRSLRGAMSSEFITGNFANKKVHDIIYVSTNGFYPTLKGEINTEVYQYTDLPWDAADNITTHSETITKAAIETSDGNPNKRLIIHYLQPHRPYIGEFGHSKLEFEGDLKDLMRKSQVAEENVWTAHIENLNIVLDEVAVLNESLDRKTVVTMDHNEVLGEKIGPSELYGHFRGVYRDELVKVPWHMLEYDSRRDIIAEEPVSDIMDLDDRKLNQRLEDLGYKI